MHRSEESVIVDDIYGQVHPVETPELVQAKLKEFLTEFEKIPTSKKTNALLAKEKCPQLITDEFKLFFLRCEVFKSDLAVRRYVAYWDKRVELFGIDQAFQPLTIHNLTPEDIAAGEIGFVSIIKSNEPDKRTVFYANPSNQDKTQYERINMVRFVWYITHIALQENIFSQQRGLLLISCPKNAKFSQFDNKQDQMLMSSIQGYLPVRISAIHICHPPSFFRIIWPIVKIFLSKRIKKRVRVHMGTTQYVLDTLINEFGLSIQDIPTELGGKYIVDPTKFLEHRRSIETM